MTYRNAGTILVFAAAAAQIGCSGSSGIHLDQTPIHSDSYSPIQATDAQGQPAKQLWWLYRVNGGAPVSVSENGMAMQMTFEDMVYSLNPVSLTRELELKGTFTGSAEGQSMSGSYSCKATESITLGDTTLVRDQQIEIDMNLSAAGQSGVVTMKVDQLPEVPWEWFLDRTDLNTLPIGYTETQNIAQQVTGSIRISAGGQSQSQSLNQAAQSTDTWTVTGQQASTDVNGVTYTDIVQIQRNTESLDMSGNNQPVQYTYDVARGVGFVRSLGAAQVYNTPLPVELVDTNLSQ
jgi:hypothetical protein